MKNSLKLVFAGAAFVFGLGMASAHASNLDVVRDSNGTPIKTESGDCLRSAQPNSYDACGGNKPVAQISTKIMHETKSVYFAFGKSSLTKDGKKALDAFVAEAKAKGLVVSVQVAGFADRIGNAAKNEKLSKKRADVVRKYLVSKGIVNAQVVETRWFGDSAASTNCPKKMPKAKLIKCLQPDRRVDVEIEYAPVTTPAPAVPVAE